MMNDIVYNMEYDEWRPVRGFPDYYVSATGQIYGPGRHGEAIILNPTPGKHGHLYVSLYKDGIPHKRYVHRLVAESFIPNPHHYPVVRHLNDYPEENYVENLAWGTQQDNIADMRKSCNDYHLTDDDREKAYEARRMAIKARSLFTNDSIIFSSQQEAARKLGIHQSAISGIISKKLGRKSAKGYTFERFTEGDYE